MHRRTRWIRWARETSKVRRKVHAQAGIRRAYPPDDIRRWVYLEGFPEGIHFHGEKPNPFRGWRYPYRPEDGPLRWLARTTFPTVRLPPAAIPRSVERQMLEGCAPRAED